ncbi:MFS transporter [Polyangium sorediatum]|uniref:MFS transporter n=1 Tax=Polyangium sorediatum TaxID=889274 RepID=A0ABT6NYG7_9BACT|nr:MFS transporter [Polyangium sorediatum]MDI1433390.1 MFS transporter [Polyangium sorediatum]
MPPLSQSRPLRSLVLGALYLAQGLPAGFIFILYVVFLTDQGLDNSAIAAAMGIMFVASALKIVWASLMDRIGTTRFGRRRPFIILGELGMGATLLCLLFLDPKRDFDLVRGVLFLHATFTSIQDAAADAMAIELLQPGERGRANGVMWAARCAGVAISGGVGPMMVKRVGFSALIVIITIILGLIMLLMILVRERASDEAPPAHEQRKLTLAELRASFAFSAPLVGIAIALLMPFGPALIGTVFTRLLRADLKLSVEFIGVLAGVIEPVSAIVGGLLGGFLADRFGMRWVAGGTLVLFSATLGVFGLMPHLWTAEVFLVSAAIAVQFFGSSASAVMVGIYMRLTNPAVGATQLALFTAMSSLTGAVAAPLGGRIADTWGAPAVFCVAAVLQLFFTGLLPFCDPRAAEARFRTTVA